MHMRMHKQEGTVEKQWLRRSKSHLSAQYFGSIYQQNKYMNEDATPMYLLIKLVGREMGHKLQEVIKCPFIPGKATQNVKIKY